MLTATEAAEQLKLEQQQQQHHQQQQQQPSHHHHHDDVHNAAVIAAHDTVGGGVTLEGLDGTPGASGQDGGHGMDGGGGHHGDGTINDSHHGHNHGHSHNHNHNDHPHGHASVDTAAVAAAAAAAGDEMAAGTAAVVEALAAATANGGADIGAGGAGSAVHMQGAHHMGNQGTGMLGNHKMVAITNTDNITAAMTSNGALNENLSGVAAATAAIGVTKHSWSDGSYRRVPNDYRLETTVSPLEAWQRWHLGEVLTITDSESGTTNNIVIPPWKTLGSADLKGHSKYSTNTTNQDIKNVRLICRAFDAAAALTAESTPTAEELRTLYETQKVKSELPPNETPKGRKREVTQLSWLTCAKDKRRRLSLENPDKERHPGGRPRKSSVMHSSKMGSEHPANSMAAAAAAAAASFAASGGGASDSHGMSNEVGDMMDDPAGGVMGSPGAMRRSSNYMAVAKPAARAAVNKATTVPKTEAQAAAEEEIVKQKAIQERQKTFFELLKSRAELTKLGVSEEHINKYFPLPPDPSTETLDTSRMLEKSEETAASL